MRTPARAHAFLSRKGAANLFRFYEWGQGEEHRANHRSAAAHPEAAAIAIGGRRTIMKAADYDRGRSVPRLPTITAEGTQHSVSVK
ncbi:hypothetical protein GGQ85_004248 [Nitrobacter vulgaris]|nr:hypothetical protein [Nitrobacter vulgaris]